MAWPLPGNVLGRRRCHSCLLLVFFSYLVIAATVLLISVSSATVPASEYQTSLHHQYSSKRSVVESKRVVEGELIKWMAIRRRRMLIGSMAPMCTYECRGCKYRCRAEQVPVDGNDPIHSAYHYRCVCHR
ncbi:hypothetical protein Dimus_037052 [Dionaea muscipula]